MTQQDYHVAIIGAGLGGLCLAQGLKKHGIPFAVYEQDRAANSRSQGYRIRIDEVGQRALAACLPPELNLLFRQSCAVSRSAGRFFNTQLEVIDGRPSETWRSAAQTVSLDDDAPLGDLSANRSTLREILLVGIEEHVHFGKAFAHCEELPSGAFRVRFGDGEIIVADVLVGADGVNSSLRRQNFPFADPEDTNSLCIYGKTNPTPASRIGSELLAGTSVIFADRFAAIVEAMSFRFPDGTAHLTEVDDYIYWAVIGRRADLDIGDVDALAGVTLKEAVVRLARSWAVGLRSLFSEADAATVAALPVRSARLLTPWPSSRLTFVGDAIHAMSPAGGVGANTALDDSSRLAAALAKASSGSHCLGDVIADYEDNMRLRANAAITASRQGAMRLFNLAPGEVVL
ncbi:FAD-dependent oxidoreductase [Bradyrhizobium iriomotense]|uniref:FAD-dependent oxidoreductase n=1 Tax=Bradyrhizobium iriomotense TaxID=441950 RepID=UPI001B8A35AF|nr:FAD-dependent monooxygenase [Bradyrhizobium iriomotense]MBR0782846.1 FAD-dependent monooxygenase [Bradyrhizobium iriomotense]